MARFLNMKSEMQYARTVVLDPLAGMTVEPCTLLRIVNDIFVTNCKDLDAIDISATWR
jgi:hypothetical protein